MKVFLDTNVILSAHLWKGGICDQVYRLVIGQYELVLSEVVLEEVKEKLEEKFSVPEEEIGMLEAELRTYPVAETPIAPAPYPIEDPDDPWILASAIHAEVDVLVTGDKLFQALRDQVNELDILSPRAFVDQYGS